MDEEDSETTVSLVARQRAARIGLFAAFRILFDAQITTNTLVFAIASAQLFRIQ